LRSTKAASVSGWPRHTAWNAGRRRGSLRWNTVASRGC